MTNIEKFKNAFIVGLEIPFDQVEKATMDSVDKWDSIGQMSLIAIIEDSFNFEFDPDEIMAFISYSSGLEILRNHHIEL